MSSYADQGNVRGQAYPQVDGKLPAYVAPPPVGYPTNSSTSAYSNQAPITTSRGDGFWRGCCAALCCCCLLDMCF